MIVLEEVLDMVRKKLRNKLPADYEITGESDLDELGLSSLQVADIIFALEDKYEFEFDLAKALGIVSIKDVVAAANEAIAEYHGVSADGQV
ncbi:acyl carrier protein [Actinocorallia herbida]|uniref:Acyl carrier protein n=1 Tax=Actinocorallia herbida TaxID=58109 RepID=A0A3N1DCH0_9ACTN|nr:phosphopantetheine-binding protein [Actinocorallia herbida]ROO90828.1 acyl carrier protein [Actinocorallia herbida]